MSVSLSCKGCKTTLKVPDQFAGKKVKCPKCNAVVTVPEEEEIVAVEAKEQRVKAGPARKGSPSHYDEDDSDSARRRRVKTSRDRDDDDDDRRSRYREEDDEDRRRRRRRDDDEPLSPFKPCPRCGAEKSRRVMWTTWGSFYGPSLFNHVRCPKCGTTYNGKTGRSNTLAAIVFVSIPLLGIGAIIGAILFMLMRRGHL